MKHSTPVAATWVENRGGQLIGLAEEDASPEYDGANDIFVRPGTIAE